MGCQDPVLRSKKGKGEALVAGTGIACSVLAWVHSVQGHHFHQEEAAEEEYSKSLPHNRNIVEENHSGLCNI